MGLIHIAAVESGPVADRVRKGVWYPSMPPILRDESLELYTNRLIGAYGPKRVPYNHKRNRQCSIGFHDECSDSEGLRCQCPCHREAAA